MSNIQHQGPTDQSPEDIQDAEFVEVGEDEHSAPLIGIKPKRSRGCLISAVIGGGLLLLLSLCVASLPPDSNEATDVNAEVAIDASSPEAVACARSDVLAVVSKETRSILLKTALPRLVGEAALGLVDLNRFRENWEAAEGKFANVQLQGEPDRDRQALSVACTGSFRIDMSNAVVGQDVLQLPQLRWTVHFGGNDPASEDFTIDVDQPSLYEDMSVNGKSVVAQPAAEPTPSATPLTISQMLTPEEAWFDGPSVMLDTMGPNDQPQCDGSVWNFDSSGPNTFTLRGGDSDTITSGKYSFDGATLRLYDMLVTPVGSGNDTATGRSTPDTTYSAAKLPMDGGKAFRIGKTNYRLCAPG